MDDRLRSDAPANNGLQSGFRAARHDLGIDTAFALQQAEGRSLTRRAAPALAPDAASAEVAFIDFHLAGEWRHPLALFGDTPTGFEKDQGDGFTPDAGQVRHVGGGKIRREVAQELAEFTPGNPGTRVIAVSPVHLSSLAPA